MTEMPEWLVDTRRVVLLLLPWLLWCAWWLGAVNWRRAGPALAQGAWVPALLLLVMAALAWSRIAGVDFVWCLGQVGILALAALFCGWLQGYFGWTLSEVSLEPPVDHGHDEHFHDHTHDDAPGYEHTPEPSHVHDDHA